MFWRPAHEWRASRGYWFLSPALDRIEMEPGAARAIYRCFNLVPEMTTAANDRDDKRW